ncbi:glycosyl transferase family 25 [Idiomarina loihiensis]|uniref:glycosyltransferase family 25 protein n=1 Tax=Idiomarina TaxID=135575 RepID=UPI000D712C16|nr:MULTISPECIES: glycosyltransferase family 25 protein [Idiomarina]PWW37662.1 glycosyl transferase family 25 [Idiomarina loihiensis]TDP47431.1 glycosyl transferase family 25 [Idiomarina loihiensis]TDS23172.1 glycosyl transferase family 25 [Idiomarina sp. H2]
MNYKTFLINLDRSKQRLADAKTQLDALNIPFERVSAADGSKLTESERACFDKSTAQQRYHYDLTWGEVGCYLSHIRCWQKIVDEKLDYAVILEDDLHLNEDFVKIHGVLEQLEYPWSFIKLGNPFKSRQETPLEKQDGFSLVSYDKAPSGTCAQVVSYEAAKRLLAARSSFFRPVDVDLQWQWEVPIKVLGLTPYVAGHNLSFLSEIQQIEQRKDKQKRRLVKIKEMLRFKWQQRRSRT